MKRIIFLCLPLCIGLLSACGGGTVDPSNDEASSAGAVYYLNFKPEQDEAWKALADAYTGETGVPVTVVTAASGTYEQNLMSEMAKSNPPTLFQVNGPVGLSSWKDYCLDLSGAAILDELTSQEYALSEGGAVYGIGYVIETYGIITNKTLLARAGYSIDEIQSFAQLKAVAEDITARREQLGFSAFTSAGMDGSSDWRFKTHLANLPVYFEYRDHGIGAAEAIQGAYLDQYKAIWDLYIQNAVCAPDELAGKTSDDARHEFLTGQAVFYQNGSWEYTALTGEGAFSDEELAMLPIYIGVGDEADQGLCTGTENYWCVNSSAAQEDIQATLDFMTWCVTSETGTRAMAEEMGFVIPFRAAVQSPNLFVRQDAEMTAAGKRPVGWIFSTMPSEQWKNDLASALTAYAAGTEDWSAVETAFVDGWAAEYEALHSA